MANPYLKRYQAIVKRYEDNRPEENPKRYAVVFRTGPNYVGRVITGSLYEIAGLITDNYLGVLDGEVAEPDQVIGPWDLSTGRKLDMNLSVTFSLDGSNIPIRKPRPKNIGV